MSQAMKNPGTLKGHRSNSKDSITLRNFRAVSHITETSGMATVQSSPKHSLKSKIMPKISKDGPGHKRTISDSSLKTFQENNPAMQTGIQYRKLKIQLEKTINSEEKVNILLVFIEGLLKINTGYNEILATISEVVREYQKYVKNLDSTRVESNEFKFDVKNTVFSKDCSRKILYKKQKNGLSNDEPTEIQTKKPEMIKCESLLLKKRDLIRANRENTGSVSTKNISHKRTFTIPGLSIPVMQDKGYHEEFLDMFDEFSDSWKEELLKLNNK